MNKNNIMQLIRDIENEVHLTRHYIGKNKLDERVMQAVSEVPRDQFVPAHLKDNAFQNCPLPIGYSQTISQPYIVALMSDLLSLQPEHKVLEIGTGSGYQTAILSRLCEKVYTVEVISQLSKLAEERFNRLNYTNINCRIGNGYEGWAEQSPYDAVIVTAAADSIPTSLIEQLKPGGNMVIPLGKPYSPQELALVRKKSNGELDIKTILGVAFVPLVHNEPVTQS